MISDFFTPEKRGRALGAFGAAGPVGAGAGLLITGLVLGYFISNPLTLPYIGQLEPWQSTLMCIGLPGLFVLVLMQAVPEPRTRNRQLAQSSAAPLGVPLSEVLAYLRANRRTFCTIVLGTGCYYAAVYGSGAWVPSYFVREYGWSYAKIGTLMGAIMCICSPLGVLAASWLGEFWRNRGISTGNLRVAILASVGLLLVSPPLLLSTSATLAIPFLAISTVLWFCLFGIGPALIIEISPLPMRGQFIALFTGALNFIGAGIGPVAIGVLTDHVFADPTAIKYSILIVTMVSCVLSLALFISARHSFAATTLQAQQWRACNSTNDH